MGQAMTITKPRTITFLSSLGYDPRNYESAAHKNALKGVSYGQFEKFATYTGLTEAQLATALGIPSSTHSRRKIEVKLSSTESERLLRFMKRFDETLELFDRNPEATRLWFLKSRPALGGKMPIELMTTEFGGKMVERLVGQLIHGVYV